MFYVTKCSTPDEMLQNATKMLRRNALKYDENAPTKCFAPCSTKCSEIQRKCSDEMLRHMTKMLRRNASLHARRNAPKCNENAPTKCSDIWRKCSDEMLRSMLDEMLRNATEMLRRNAPKDSDEMHRNMTKMLRRNAPLHARRNAPKCSENAPKCSECCFWQYFISLVQAFLRRALHFGRRSWERGCTKCHILPWDRM